MGMFEHTLTHTERRKSGFSKPVERRKSVRLPQLQSSQTNMTSHLWDLELLPAIALDRLQRDITDLAKRSVEPNIFFEKEILLAAWPRLTSILAPHGNWMLCLWETINEKRVLRFFMPVRMNKVGLPKKRVLQPLSNEYMPIGTPLVDDDCAGEAVETLLRMMGDPELGLPNILDLTHQRQSGPIYQLFKDAADSLGLPTANTNSHDRAALNSTDDPEAFLNSLLKKKRKRELARQMRRLSDDGNVTFHVARTEEESLNAFEEFVTLELQSWKGRKGTALYNHKDVAAFSRQIVAELALNKGGEIFSLKKNTTEGEETLASIIMLGRNGYYAPWKMAYNEKLASFSPGMQLMHFATEQLVKRKSFKSADSLAVSDHWMMNTTWPDRILITDLLIGLNSQVDKELHACQRAKNRYGELKTSVKSILGTFVRAFHVLIKTGQRVNKLN